MLLSCHIINEIKNFRVLLCTVNNIKEMNAISALDTFLPCEWNSLFLNAFYRNFSTFSPDNLLSQTSATSRIANDLTLPGWTFWSTPQASAPLGCYNFVSKPQIFKVFYGQFFHQLIAKMKWNEIVMRRKKTRKFPVVSRKKKGSITMTLKSKEI